MTTDYLPTPTWNQFGDEPVYNQPVAKPNPFREPFEYVERIPEYQRTENVLIPPTSNWEREEERGAALDTPFSEPIDDTPLLPFTG